MAQSLQSCPSEAQECAALAQWLDRHGVLFTHVPMGEIRDPAAGAKLKRMGAKRGVPDMILFSGPGGEALPSGCKGYAVEMKRRKGGRVSPEQRKWLDRLSNLGWETVLARGAGNAADQIWALWEAWGLP